MSASISSQQYGQAILEHASNGRYPNSEQVVSAELPSSALTEVAGVIESACEELREKLRAISQASARDVDGWISQAKQLRVDIAQSKAEAGKIAAESPQIVGETAATEDASRKIELLNEEVHFNESLSETLKRLKDLHQRLDAIQWQITEGSIVQAANALDEFSHNLPLSFSFRGAHIAGVLDSSYVTQREEVARKLTRCWGERVQVIAEKKRVEIRLDGQGFQIPTLQDVTDALLKLDLLDTIIPAFCSDLERLIFEPRLRIQADGTRRMLKITNDAIEVSEASSDLSAESLFSDLEQSLRFLQKRLPQHILEALMDLLSPRLTTKLVSTWLMSSIPEDLESMSAFQDTVSRAKTFADTLDSHGWPGSRRLNEWAHEIPQNWLKKRRNLYLDKLRRLLSHGLGDITLVERKETQVLDKRDDVFAGGGADEWDTKWSDDGNDSPRESTTKSQKAPEEAGDDFDAWGLDDDKDTGASASRQTAPEQDDDDGGDAWGWNDDNDEADDEAATRSPLKIPSNPISNGTAKHESPAERTVTLTETFHISSIPRRILEIVERIKVDITFLTSHDGADNRLVSEVPELLSLPGVMLAMYRAIGATTYSLQPSGRMFLYNDTIWLSQQLVELRGTIPDEDLGAQRTGDEMISKGQLDALQIFGKRSYGKEMDAQRTIINDLLDGAQGFAQCTKSPFNQECSIAVASTVDRLRMLHKEWKSVLSSTALLQSIGSLVATAISKIIVDIEDMPDIEETESQQLTRYCSEISSLEDLFMPEKSDTDEQAVPPTAFYVPNWFKFQYLVNILESSMVDIKYLWTESELSLEFQTEEVVELIRALFADSPHRRTAIAEIRDAKR